MEAWIIQIPSKAIISGGKRRSCQLAIFESIVDWKYSKIIKFKKQEIWANKAFMRVTSRKPDQEVEKSWIDFKNQIWVDEIFINSTEIKNGDD